MLRTDSNCRADVYCNVSSTVTPKMAARMIRLSTVGHSHTLLPLVYRIWSGKSKYILQILYEKPAFCLSFTIFLPVPVMSIVGTLHIILPSQNSHLICIATIVADFFFTKTSSKTRKNAHPHEYFYNTHMDGRFFAHHDFNL